jgi:hypothetical protein
MITKAMYRVVVVAGVLVLCSMFAGGASAQPVSQHVTLTGYVSCTTCLLPNACKAQSGFPAFNGGLARELLTCSSLAIATTGCQAPRKSWRKQPATRSQSPVT